MIFPVFPSHSWSILIFRQTHMIVTVHQIVCHFPIMSNNSHHIYTQAPSDPRSQAIIARDRSWSSQRSAEEATINCHWFLTVYTYTYTSYTYTSYTYTSYTYTSYTFIFIYFRPWINIRDICPTISYDIRDMMEAKIRGAYHTWELNFRGHLQFLWWYSTSS